MISMKDLDSPIKRLFFIIFFVGIAIAAFIALLPSPYIVRTSGEWKPGVKLKRDSDSTERGVAIDASCGAIKLGKRSAYAYEFFVIQERGVSDFEKNRYRLAIHRDGPYSIADIQYLRASEIERIRFAFDSNPILCEAEFCTKLITSEVFEALLRECSREENFVYVETQITESNIDKNISEYPTIFVGSIILSIIGLFGSILFRPTVGRVIKWIKFGTNEKDV